VVSVSTSMCGKSSLEEDMRGHSVGTSSLVVCVNPEESSWPQIGKDGYACDVYLTITNVMVLTGMLQLQPREEHRRTG
jgi:hypothetical protein